MITKNKISKFLNCQNLLKRGQKHYEAGHVQNFHHENGLIKAKVKASMKANLYYVEVEIKNGDIADAKCECKVGKATCSHMAAVLLHYLENVSGTDVPCVWAARKAPKGSEITDLGSLFPKHEKIEIKEVHTEEMRRMMSNSLNSWKVNPGMSWILSPEVYVLQVDMLATSSKISANLNEVIFTEKFKEKSIDERKNVLLDFLLSDTEIVEISERTIGQFENPFYCNIRKCRITASVMGKILERKRETPCKSILKTLAGEYGDLGGVNSIRYGRTRENEALAQFQQKYSMKAEKCGIFLHLSGLLGASPDAIGIDFIVEIKCLYKHCSLNPITAISKYKDYFIQQSPGKANEMSKQGEDKYFKITRLFPQGNGISQISNKFVANRKHDYWHQMQAQIVFAGKKFGIFIASTDLGIEAFRIEKDPEWHLNIGRLLNFYHIYYVPYILERYNCDG